MMVRLACPGAWPRLVGAPLPPSSGITSALAAVLGKPLAVHRLPHGRPAHDRAGEGFGAFAPLVARLAPLLSETPEAYAGDGGKERHAMVARKSTSPKRGCRDGPNIARSRQVASAAVAASAKRPACQLLSMPGSARRSALLLRRPAPWGVGVRGVSQAGGAAGIRPACLWRVRIMCAERAVSAVVAGTAPAVGWSAGRGAPLEAAGVFRRSSRWVKQMG